MKVQSQPQAVVIQQANPTTSAAVAERPTDAGFAPGSAGQLPTRFEDGFEQRPVNPDRPGIIDCIPPYPYPPVADSLSLEDRLTSTKLPMTLSNPLHKALLESGHKDVVISRDIMGMMRGPEGQPLARVWLNDGTTAYVDPNTNHYYLTDESEIYGRTNAMGPLDLPAGATFSNSYFNDPEVRSIQQLSQAWGSPFPGPVDPLPPRPEPFPTDPGPLPPLPLPGPRIPEDWLNWGRS